MVIGADIKRPMIQVMLVPDVKVGYDLNQLKI